MVFSKKKCWLQFMQHNMSQHAIPWHNITQFEGILPKGPYLPCVSMAGKALLAGYPQIVLVIEQNKVISFSWKNVLILSETNTDSLNRTGIIFNAQNTITGLINKTKFWRVKIVITVLKLIHNYQVPALKNVSSKKLNSDVSMDFLSELSKHSS